MSHEFESRYELERQRRLEIEKQRVRNNTEGFFSKYNQVYENLISQGLDKFIPDEVERLKNDLNRIRNLLVNEPFAARDISFQVQNYVYTLITLGRTAKFKFEEVERERIRKLEEEERKQRELEEKIRNEKLVAMAKEYFLTVRSIKNPAVQNFSSEGLKQIKSKLDANEISDIETLKSLLNEVVTNAQQKADEWKSNALKETERESLNQQIEQLKTSVASEKIEDKEKQNQIIRTIEDLKQKNVSVEDIKKEIIEVQKTVDEVVISEDVRREAVKAIVKQLRSQNFTVNTQNIQLIKNGDEDFVKIYATMPSGKRAVCNLTNKGKIIYKFDNYEGMTCLKDIQKFNVDLEKIYSVKLSDERVLWSNPDEIGKDADKLPTSSNMGENR